MIPLEPESDLHWLAFLYVSGDLPPEEATRFECLLADDQDVREAVFQAVELTEALAVVGPRAAESRKRQAGRRVLVGTLSMAAAACLALAILPRFRSSPPTPPDASQVAAAWSGLRGGPDADWLASIDDSDTTETANSTPTPSADAESSTERALPSWLLSAASAPRNETPQEEN